MSAEAVWGVVGGVGGAVGAVAAVVAIWYAHKSISAASTSNALANRAEARATERHDVTWDDDWVTPSHGVYGVIKRGDDPAHKVHITVVFDGEEQTQKSELMEADGSLLTFEFPSAVQAYSTERRKRRQHTAEKRRAEERADAFPFSAAAQFVSPPMPAFHYITVRVTWVTALDTPKVWENERRMMTF